MAELHLQLQITALESVGTQRGKRGSIAENSVSRVYFFCPRSCKFFFFWRNTFFFNQSFFLAYIAYGKKTLFHKKRRLPRKSTGTTQ